MMDFIKRMLGIPPRDNQIQRFIPPIIEEEEESDDLNNNAEEIFVEFGNNNNDILHVDEMLPSVFEEMKQEIAEIELIARDFWNIFNHSSFSDDFKNKFRGVSIYNEGEGESTFPRPNLPRAELPQPENEPATLRDRMLKPSLLPPSSSPGQKKDEDLDNLVQKEGLGALFDDNKKIVPQRRNPNSFFQFKSITMQTIVKPDGSLEHRRVERDSDGNEKVTVTEEPPRHPPNGSNFGPAPFLNPSFYPQREGDSFFSKLFKH